MVGNSLCLIAATRTWSSTGVENGILSDVILSNEDCILDVTSLCNFASCDDDLISESGDLGGVVVWFRDSISILGIESSLSK
jgi:hypothetical protein